MAKHKKQHFVPQSYLKPWCDPRKPKGQDPFVWRFNKDGSDPRRKAPENLFHETDLYTIRRADGERDLVLEHGLAGLEAAFVRIRDTKLGRRKALTRAEYIMICAFIAAASARTPAHRDHHREQWGGMLEMMERIEESARKMTPEQRRHAFPSLHSSGPTLGYEEVKHLAEEPMQTMLLPSVRVMTPLLAGLNCAVLESKTGAAFITSDNPCVWFDPEAYRRPPFFRGPGLAYPSLEITLPISPRHALVLNRRVPSGYIGVKEHSVDEFNRRTRGHCSEYFVSSSDVTKPIWFDEGLEPEDSWEKEQARKKPDSAAPEG